MSVQFTVILGHDEIDPQRVLETLRGAAPYVGTPLEWDLFPAYGNLELQWKSLGWIEVDGPGDAMTVGRHAFWIWKDCPWHAFLTLPTVQDELRRWAREIAAAFGRRRCIYVPSGEFKESAALEQIQAGKDFDELLQWLTETCGPPSKTIEAILVQTEMGWTSKGYFVDDLCA